MGTKTKWPVQKRLTQYETRKTTRRNRHLKYTISLYFIIVLLFLLVCFI